MKSETPLQSSLILHKSGMRMHTCGTILIRSPGPAKTRSLFVFTRQLYQNYNLGANYEVLRTICYMKQNEHKCTYSSNCFYLSASVSNCLFMLAQSKTWNWPFCSQPNLAYILHENAYRGECANHPYHITRHCQN